MSDPMLQEAIAAVKAGDRARARDLLTRLLRADQGNPEYWLWMSSAVETEREQVFCLQSLLKLRPDHAAAKRGLVILGILPPGEAGPAGMPVHGLAFDASARAGVGTEAKGGSQSGWGNPRNRRLVLFGGSGIVVLLLISLAAVYLRSSRGTPVAVVPTSTSGITLTPMPTWTPPASPTLVIRTATPQSAGPVPLSTLFPTPRTPTPFYAATSHPGVEAYSLGLRALTNGELDKALGYFKQVIGLSGEYPDAHFFAGEIYRAQSEAAGATTGKGKGLLASAIEQYNLALGLNNAFAPGYLGRALANLSLGMRDTVLDDLNRAVEFDPAYVDAWMARAGFVLTQGDVEAAVTDLFQAGTLAPEDARVLVSLSLALFQRGDFESALDEAGRGLALDPTQVEGYLARGQANGAQGNLESAKDDLDFYLTYMPEDPRGYLQRGHVLLQMGETEPAHYTAAVADFTQALALNKGMTEALVARGQAQLALLQFTDAEKDFSAALAKGKSFDALLGRGQAYLGQNKGSPALNDFKSALGLVPDSFDAELGMGRAYLALNRLEEAIAEFTLAASAAANPEQSGLAYYWRAQAYEKAGQHDLAVADWQAILALPLSNSFLLQTASEHLNTLRAVATASAAAASSPTPSATTTATRTPSGTATPTPKATSTP